MFEMKAYTIGFWVHGVLKLCQWILHYIVFMNAMSHWWRVMKKLNSELGQQQMGGCNEEGGEKRVTEENYAEVF